jgi:hypothetical protein
MRAHDPLAPPLTAREIIRLLNRPVAVRTVQWHMQAIRAEALLSPQFIPEASPATLEKRDENNTAPENA